MEMVNSKQSSTDKVLAKGTKVRGAEALIHCLIAEGVDLVYGYPGGAIMPVYDELYKFQGSTDSYSDPA